MVSRESEIMKTQIEKTLSEKGVILKDFDDLPFAENCTYNGFPVEGYTYDEKGQAKELPKEICRLIDEYNGMQIDAYRASLK